VGALVALYLAPCCGWALWWLAIVFGFALAWIVTFLLWVRRCHPTCVQIFSALGGALGIVITIVSYLNQYVLVTPHNCGLPLLPFIGALIILLSAIAARFCHP